MVNMLVFSENVYCGGGKVVQCTLIFLMGGVGRCKRELAPRIPMAKVDPSNAAAAAAAAIRVRIEGST
jgi:hypothetical protein